MKMHTIIFLDNGYAQTAVNFILPEKKNLETFLQEKFAEELDKKNCIIIDRSKAISDYEEFGNTSVRRFNVIQLETIQEL